MTLAPSDSMRVRHARVPQPLHFPEGADVTESKRHLLLRTFLFQLLHHTFGKEHSIGCDQFVYWNAAEPSRCVEDVGARRTRARRGDRQRVGRE